MADVPVLDVTPTDGALRYDEGIHVGYRAWLRSGTAPAFPFGHGLGYTAWSWDAAERDGDELVVRVTNTGQRPGRQVVQVYAERADSSVERPARWLVGFQAVEAGPGESVEARIAVPLRRLAHWDGAWVTEAGDYTLLAGASVVETPLTTVWTVPA
jgi:beta-glucosidase